jgi:hypothetical protein
LFVCCHFVAGVVKNSAGYFLCGTFSFLQMSAAATFSYQVNAYVDEKHVQKAFHTTPVVTTTEKGVLHWMVPINCTKDCKMDRCSYQWLPCTATPATPTTPATAATPAPFYSASASASASASPSSFSPAPQTKFVYVSTAEKESFKQTKMMISCFCVF